MDQFHPDEAMQQPLREKSGQSLRISASANSPSALFSTDGESNSQLGALFSFFWVGEAMAALRGNNDTMDLFSPMSNFILAQGGFSPTFGPDVRDSVAHQRSPKVPKHLQLSPRESIESRSLWGFSFPNKGLQQSVEIPTFGGKGETKRLFTRLDRSLALPVRTLQPTLKCAQRPFREEE